MHHVRAVTLAQTTLRRHQPCRSAARTVTARDACPCRASCRFGVCSFYVLKRSLLQRGSRATRVASRGAPRVLRLLTHHFARARFNLVFLTDALSGSLGPKALPKPVCQAPCERAPVTFAR